MYTLPWPPTTNNLFRNVVMGRRSFRVKSSEYKQFERDVEKLLGPKVDDLPKVPVRVSVTSYRPRRIGDIDNCLKATLDVLSGRAYRDDADITRLEIVRCDDKVNPRVEVFVEAA